MSKVPDESKILSVARYLDTGRLSQKQIAEACHVSKNLVSVIAKVMKENGWTAADVEAMSEEDRRKMFRRKDIPEPSSKAPCIYAEPDYEMYCEELKKPGVTKALLHEEYLEECRRNGQIPLQLTQFKKHLGEHLKTKPYSEIIEHKPACECEVDWVGDKCRWTDPETGEVQTAWLFVGVLPFSGYAYAEAFADMKEPNWIMAHVHMFDYFGGYTRVVICDNLRTGVRKHNDKDGIVLQEDYKNFARYYRIIVSPARVYHSNDKPSAENTVKIVETHILARMRNFQCFSLEEYNQEVRRHLDKFNARPFQKKEGSRLSVFQEYEKKELVPLPAAPYEYYKEGSATVYPNCCISYGKNFYSVPYRYRGQKVALRIYNDHLDVYDGNDYLCSHKLIPSPRGAYSIDNKHTPPYSSRYGEWNKDRILNWAREYGPCTYEVIDSIFRSGGAEQRYYNRTISILKLADSYSRPRVEQVCQFMLNERAHPTYKNIKAILASEQDLKPTAHKKPQKEESHVRGADYYEEKKV